MRIVILIPSNTDLNRGDQALVWESARLITDVYKGNVEIKLMSKVVPYNIIQQNNQIMFVGRQQDLRPFLAASDAFVFPSYREGFPNSVLEAGALGLPAIVTDINGCNEIIIQGENGEVIQPRDEQVLYNKMNEWILKPEKVIYMAGKSRKLVEDRFEQKMIWNEPLNTYKELLN